MPNHCILYGTKDKLKDWQVNPSGRREETLMCYVLISELEDFIFRSNHLDVRWAAYQRIKDNIIDEIRYA